MSEIKVLVTGAAGQIAYSLMLQVAKGDVFGPEQKVKLVMLDIPMMTETLEGVQMELQDCALPNLSEIIATTDYKVAFDGIDVAILVGAMPRRQGMERKDLLKANAGIFKGQGEALDKYAKKDVKVLVVGNPANTNCLIAQRCAPSIPKQNFSALTRLDQNRAQAQIAMKVGVANKDVKNVIIWGNHSSTQYPDVQHATVKLPNGQDVKVTEAVKDDAWLNGDFISTVQKRGGAVLAARKLSSAMSASKAIGDHVRDWWFGTNEGCWTSMGVISDGNCYGIPDGVMYSFPLKIKDRKWTIVENLPISDFSRGKMDASAAELVEERDVAMQFITES